jgi:hypothetical protein
MANEKRLRANSIGGLVEDNPLTSGATTLTSAGLAALAVVDTTNHAAIVIDPDGIEGTPEIVYVTAHASGAGSATILRAQEGTSALAHSVDIPWAHTPTARDFDQLLQWAQLRHASVDTTVTLTGGSSTTETVIDATNLSCSFTAPPSGRVAVVMSAYGSIGANTYSMDWLVMDSSPAIVALTRQPVLNIAGGGICCNYRKVVVGLTPGNAYVWRWAWRTAPGTGTINVYHGPTYGSLLMEVWAVNV